MYQCLLNSILIWLLLACISNTCLSQPIVQPKSYSYTLGECRFVAPTALRKLEQQIKLVNTQQQLVTLLKKWTKLEKTYGAQIPINRSDNHKFEWLSGERELGGGLIKKEVDNAAGRANDEMITLNDEACLFSDTLLVLDTLKLRLFNDRLAEMIITIDSLKIKIPRKSSGDPFLISSSLLKNFVHGRYLLANVEINKIGQKRTYTNFYMYIFTAKEKQLLSKQALVWYGEHKNSLLSISKTLVDYLVSIRGSKGCNTNGLYFQLLTESMGNFLLSHDFPRK